MVQSLELRLNRSNMLGLLLIFATAFVGVLGFPKDVHLIGGRVVNGTEADLADYPFMASVQYDGSHSCGGSIINECYILTAAHCVNLTKENPEHVRVMVGSVTLSGEGDVYQVSQIILHEEYERAIVHNHDIALLKLDGRIRFSDLVQPGSFPAQMEVTPGNIPARLVGWGIPYTNGSVMNHLQQVDLMTYSDEDCRKLHWLPIHDTVICAGVPEGDKGLCDGDSGGPLLANGHQVGIVSWTWKPCGSEATPGVYTEVSWYIDWIAEHANQC